MRGNRTIRYFSAHILKLPHLSSKEKEVLIRRLKTITLNNIGKKYGVTEGRIRQIERNALKRLKSKSYQQKLFKDKKE